MVGDDNDRNWQLAGRLYDYTKFHIGMYATLMVGVFAFLELWDDRDHQFDFVLLGVAFCLMGAGACGGVVCTNCLRYADDEKILFSDKASFWFWKNSGLSTKRWADMEHGFFWVGIVLVFAYMCMIITCR